MPRKRTAKPKTLPMTRQQFFDDAQRRLAELVGSNKKLSLRRVQNDQFDGRHHADALFVEFGGRIVFRVVWEFADPMYTHLYPAGVAVLYDDGQHSHGSVGTSIPSEHELKHVMEVASPLLRL